MPRLRVLVSATYFDLKSIRGQMRSFVETFGYDPMFFEYEDATSDPGVPVDQSCKVAAKACNILVLIVGGRYGRAVAEEGTINSKGKQDAYASTMCSEYISARDRKIPIYIFVEGAVLSEYQTYKKNKALDIVEYAHVDSQNVFRVLESIAGISRGNFVRPFSYFEEISGLLREQWADLFADLIIKRSEDAELKDLATQLAELRQIAAALKGNASAIERDFSSGQATMTSPESVTTVDESRLQEFVAEKFIRYIWPRIPDATGKSAEKLYHNFMSSRSVETFLSLSGVPGESKTELLGMPSVERSYHDIAARYFGRNSERATPDVKAKESIKRPRRDIP